MTALQRSALRTLLVLGSAAALSGCDGSYVCTAELRGSVVVEVRDAVTGRPTASGATGVSEHESGEITEFAEFSYSEFSYSALTLFGDWRGELPGEHTITVWKPGYVPHVVDAHVDADRCHVKTETVEADIAPDPRAVSEYPIFFTEGPDTSGEWPTANAEVRVNGDTLEIKGLAETLGCTELRVVAFHSGVRLHVQVEPSDVPLDDCVDWRRFEASFSLPSGTTSLLVTNAVDFPAVLFNGKVRPSS